MAVKNKVATRTNDPKKEGKPQTKYLRPLVEAGPGWGVTPPASARIAAFKYRIRTRNTDTEKAGRKKPSQTIDMRGL